MTKQLISITMFIIQAIKPMKNGGYGFTKLWLWLMAYFIITNAFLVPYSTFRCINSEPRNLEIIMGIFVALKITNLSLLRPKFQMQMIEMYWISKIKNEIWKTSALWIFDGFNLLTSSFKNAQNAIEAESCYNDNFITFLSFTSKMLPNSFFIIFPIILVILAPILVLKSSTVFSSYLLSSESIVSIESSETLSISPPSKLKL